MWNLLWLLPAALLAWAVVLVIRKVKKAGAKEASGESEPRTLEERLEALAADESDRA
jgi:cytochrome c-type biogenesis protein CcmH/NrfF